MKTWMLAPLVASLLALTATPDAQAQSYRWGNVAMGGGGYVTAVIPSRTERNLFYARTDVGGAYRWDAVNARWVPLLDGFSEDDVGLYHVESLGLDPENSAVVYVVAGVPYFSNGKTVVMRSTDYGATWSRITDVSNLWRANGNGMGRGNGERLQVDPGNSNVLYVGSRTNGLFKSTDAGASFSRVTSLPVATTPNGAGIAFVLLDPASVVNGAAQRVFVGISRYGTVGASLYRSDDAGASFRAVANAPTAYLPQRAALASDGNLFITYGNGAGPHGGASDLTLAEPLNAGQVWKYNVASGSWTNITPAGITNAFSGVSVDPANPLRVLISTSNTWMQQRTNVYGDRFFLSTNGGTGWTDLVAKGFSLDPNGVSWISTESIHWATDIEFDPFDSKMAWVTSGNGVFRSANVDAAAPSWAFMVKGLEETVPLGIASVPGGPLVSVIGDFDGFRHGGSVDDYGHVHGQRIGTTTGLAVAAAATSTMVRVGSSMKRSGDTGATWTDVAGIRGTFGQVALSANGTALLHTFRNADGSYATYRSTNFTAGSPTWTAVGGLSTGETAPTADPVNSNKFYAYDNGTIRVSTNGGASFSASTTLAQGGSPLLRTAPGREGDVWVALNGTGLARSTNSGTSFSTIANVGYAGAVGFGKAMGGSSYPTVFIWGNVGSGKRGLYRSTDAGANWVRVNDDTHQFGGPGNGRLVAGDMNTEGRVYMSSVGRGLIYGTPAGGTLQARHSSKCLDVPGFSSSSGTALVQWNCSGGANQQWSFEAAGGGWSRVKISHSGQCLDIASQSTAGGVALIQATCNGDTSQQWVTEDMGSGYLRLKSRFSGLCVDVNAASTADGGTVIQWACGTGTNQQWKNL
ncbi:RICIN domain-containing protein [Pelomonas cellulosilytica]|uniref:RICIN domain-containing protein n=1 Tax=Pelomonas cellulosilytica TaxID=2906762 RepID=A0ABS8Y3Y7_9BURK|nr:RICIN domain-containing protein [Pelomonas sp. P8]MCE4557811.1 RICIN domain-containing protein [Pelomonas sp. P8]